MYCITTCTDLITYNTMQICLKLAQQIYVTPKPKFVICIIYSDHLYFHSLIKLNGQLNIYKCTFEIP